MLETNVKVEDNGYYEKIHEALSKKYGLKNWPPHKWVVWNVESVTINYKEYYFR